ncbi:MAG: hypothetical protein AAF787_14820 [Chloroflexota bacterium]
MAVWVRTIRVGLLAVVVLTVTIAALMGAARARPPLPLLAYREQLSSGLQAITVYDMQSHRHVRVGYAPEITFIGWTTTGQIAIKPTIQGDWTIYSPMGRWQSYTNAESPSFPIMDTPHVPEKQYLALRGVNTGWDVYLVDTETLDEDVVGPLRSLPAYPRVIWAPDEQHLMHIETTPGYFLLRHVDLATETAQVVYRYPFGEISGTLFSSDGRYMVLRVRSNVRSDMHIVVIDLVTGESYSVAHNSPRIHVIGFQPGV